MHVRPVLLPQGAFLSVPTGREVAGRLPLPWLLGLAAGLAASTLLPQGAAWLVALAVIIGLGVPHGALDGEVARPLLRPQFGVAWFPVFSAPYLGLAALVLLAWHGWPEVTLAAFLAASVWHFGEEDAGSSRWLELLTRGGLPIAVPVLLHPAATTTVLGTIALLPLPALPAWLVTGAWLWVGLAVCGTLSLVRQGRTSTLAELAGLLAAFALLPPLTAFAFYFVGFHAPRHMAALVAASGLAPRVDSTGAAIRRALPVTALTLLLGGLLWPLYPGLPADRLLTLTLQGLAALTLPHLLLTHAASPRG